MYKQHWDIEFTTIFDIYLNYDNNYLDLSVSFIHRIEYILIKNEIFTINDLSNYCNNYSNKNIATPEERTKAILSMKNIGLKSFKFLAILLAKYDFEVELVWSV